MEKIKLNLGCGDDVKSGFINLDIINRPGIKKVNLNKNKLPFKENYADYVLISHLIEYLDNPYDFMLELYRVCKDGCIIDLIVDHYSFGLSYAELRHKRPGFSYHSFGTQIWNAELYNKFKVIKKRINFTRVNLKFLNLIFNPIINISPSFYERFLSYIIPASEVHFRFKVNKKDN